MENIFDLQEEEDAASEEDRTVLLPQLNDYLDNSRRLKQLFFFYEAGMRQMTTKLQILDREFQHSNDRNPIENIKSRLKSQESIVKKMENRGLPLTIGSMVNNIYDIAGIRVICPFITDVYQIAQMLISQSDVELLQMKDYIRNPKENGYRSLHLIVKITVFLSDTAHQVPVEIQLRTIAMNFWASTEHQLRYKKDKEFTPEMLRRLKECADIMADADYQMQKLAEEIHF
ncbi:MAG: GTP pyrophosphokinase family protein [Clostridiales bacterium]|nr:GTP pyrophosphokinase family protein [Clostridiales bacterium]MCD8109058.1 GTP pyrophosphokinase family protein [Clostridiales bacterium]